MWLMSYTDKLLTLKVIYQWLGDQAVVPHALFILMPCGGVQITGISETICHQMSIN